MENQNNPTNGNMPINHQPSHPKERLCFKSNDGLVEVVVKCDSARRFPQHAYPVVCRRLRPQAGSRVLEMAGDGGLEVLLTHKEVAAHLKALNTVDGKAQYRWVEIPEKPESRKAYWRNINAVRHQKSRR